LRESLAARAPVVRETGLVEEHGIPEEDYPAAFARWIAERTGGPVPRFEKVEETGDE
jgi:hypothetical protein